MINAFFLKPLLVGTIALTLALTLFVFGKQSGKPTRESQMLMHLLSMEDAELTRLRQTVERIEAMSPEERANMRHRLGTMQRMDPEKRQAARKRFEAIPREQREAMKERWFSMSPEERKKLRNMSPEERRQAIENEGFLPPHPRKSKDKSPQNDRGEPAERIGPPPSLR